MIYLLRLHVRHGNEEMVIEIGTLQVLGGDIPPRALGLVIEWAFQHKDELLNNWELAKANQAPKKNRAIEIKEDEEMIKDVISAHYKGEYKIEVTFEDGATGVVDFSNTRLDEFTGYSFGEQVTSAELVNSAA